MHSLTFLNEFQRKGWPRKIALQSRNEPVYRVHYLRWVKHKPKIKHADLYIHTFQQEFHLWNALWALLIICFWWSRTSYTTERWWWKWIAWDWKHELNGDAPLCVQLKLCVTKIFPDSPQTRPPWSRISDWWPTRECQTVIYISFSKRKKNDGNWKRTRGNGAKKHVNEKNNSKISLIKAPKFGNISWKMVQKFVFTGINKMHPNTHWSRMLVKCGCKHRSNDGSCWLSSVPR